MENIFFNRKTNTDFQEILNRPVIKTKAQIRKAEVKRLTARLQRHLKNKH